MMPIMYIAISSLSPFNAYGILAQHVYASLGVSKISQSIYRARNGLLRSELLLLN